MFVTFEGPEGAGKSTALREIAQRLREAGHPVLETREPGAGTVGTDIRRILLHGDDLPPATELLLFLADRAHHMDRIIRPALAEGKWVLCDRHTDSTYVYQAVARGLDPDFVRRGNQFATGGLRPDLTLLFDLPVEIGLSRLVSPDRLDREPLEFHQKVRSGFLDLAREEPDRFRVIDASQSPESVVEVGLQYLLRI